MKTKFYHLRVPYKLQMLEHVGGKKKPTTIAVNYTQPPSLFGGATVCVQIDGEKYTVSSAICSPHDAFCRDYGRVYATQGRPVVVEGREVFNLISLVWDEMLRVNHIPKSERISYEDFLKIKWANK